MYRSRKLSLQKRESPNKKAELSRPILQLITAATSGQLRQYVQVIGVSLKMSHASARPEYQSDVITQCTRCHTVMLVTSPGLRRSLSQMYMDIQPRIPELLCHHLQKVFSGSRNTVPTQKFTEYRKATFDQLLSSDDSVNLPQPYSLEDIKKDEDAMLEFMQYNMNQAGCCVCCRLVPAKSLATIPFSQLKSAKRQLLAATTPEELILLRESFDNFVDLHEAEFATAGLSLTQSEVFTKYYIDSSGTTLVNADVLCNICITCNNSLIVSHKLPAVSCAYGYFIGYPPRCFQDVTSLERIVLGYWQHQLYQIRSLFEACREAP